MRDRVVLATLELVGELGVGGLSNRLVASRAGISPGTLTYHFASQAELLRAALEAYVEEEVARLSVIADGLRASRLDLAGAVAQAREAIEEGAGRTAQVAQLELYLHASRDEDLQETAARCFAAYDDIAAAVLEAAGVADVDRFAPLVTALVDGAQLRRLAGGPALADAADALEGLVGLLGAAAPA